MSKQLTKLFGQSKVRPVHFWYENDKGERVTCDKKILNNLWWKYISSEWAEREDDDEYCYFIHEKPLDINDDSSVPDYWQERTLHDLYKLALKEWEKRKESLTLNRYSGLCSLYMSMYHDLTISIEDKTALGFELEKDYPRYHIYTEGYIWPKYEHEPRVEYLKKKIKQTKSEQ
jgi:hypothetical protein